MYKTPIKGWATKMNREIVFLRYLVSSTLKLQPTLMGLILKFLCSWAKISQKKFPPMSFFAQPSMHINHHVVKGSHFDFVVEFCIDYFFLKQFWSIWFTRTQLIMDVPKAQEWASLLLHKDLCAARFEMISALHLQYWFSTIELPQIRFFVIFYKDATFRIFTISP